MRHRWDGMGAQRTARRCFFFGGGVSVLAIPDALVRASPWRISDNLDSTRHMFRAQGGAARDWIEMRIG